MSRLSPWTWSGLCKSLAIVWFAWRARSGRRLPPIRETRPGLVLADIQLADGSSGLDAMNEILPDFSVPGDLCHGISRKAAHRRKTGADISHPQTLYGQIC